MPTPPGIIEHSMTVSNVETTEHTVEATMRSAIEAYPGQVVDEGSEPGEAPTGDFLSYGANDWISYGNGDWIGYG